MVIISMLAAIAVPRFSNAAQAAKTSNLNATITRVSNAIEQYYAEHGRYPGYKPTTGEPHESSFVKQLTRYSDAQGDTKNTLEYPYIYGPYLRAPFSTNPLNDLNTVKVIKTPTSSFTAGSTGWIAVLDTGHFGANSPSEGWGTFGAAGGSGGDDAQNG